VSPHERGVSAPLFCRRLFPDAASVCCYALAVLHSAELARAQRSGFLKLYGRPIRAIGLREAVPLMSRVRRCFGNAGKTGPWIPGPHRVARSGI